MALGFPSIGHSETLEVERWRLPIPAGQPREEGRHVANPGQTDRQEGSLAGRERLAQHQIVPDALLLLKRGGVCVSVAMLRSRPPPQTWNRNKKKANGVVKYTPCFFLH